MTSAYKPVLIVGYPRSGTTWTMWLLSQHPQVVTSFHSGLFHALDAIDKWRNEPGTYGKFILPSPAAENGRAETGGRQIPLQTAVPAGFPDKHLRRMVYEFLDSLAEYGSSPQVIVENTPENLEFLPWILDIIPEVRVLHVIRDPRSVWLSVRNSFRSWMNPRNNGAFPSTLLKNTLRWCEYQEMARDIQERAGHYAEIRYEDLISDGVGELGRVFQWLELPVDNDFCRQALAGTSLDKLKQLMPSPAGFFGRGGTDGWQALSNSEIKQIEYLAGGWMEKLNYERRFPKLDKQPWQLAVSRKAGQAAGFLRRRLHRW